MLPFSLLIANGPFGRHGPFAISSRSQFGWQRAQLKETAIGRVVERASGLTPELPVHIELIPPLLVLPLLVPPLLVPPLLVPTLLRFQALVPPLLRLQALVPMVQRQPCRVCNFWIALGSFVFARCGGYKQVPDFTRAGPPHCPVDASSLVFFAAPEARTFIRRIHHNEVEQDTF